MTLSDMDVILCLHTKQVSVMQALQESFQVTPEGEAVIRKKSNQDLLCQ